MKEHFKILLLGTFGLVLSFTLVIALLYSYLSNKENLTVKNLRQTTPTEAEEINKQKQPSQNNTLDPEKVFSTIDKNFNSEENITVPANE